MKRSITSTLQASRNSTLTEEHGHNRSAAKEAEIERKFEQGKKLMKELNLQLKDFEVNLVARQSKDTKETLQHWEGLITDQKKKIESLSELQTNQEEVLDKKIRQRREKLERDIAELQAKCDEDIQKMRLKSEEFLSEKETALTKTLRHYESEFDRTNQKLLNIRVNLVKPKMLEKALARWESFKEDWMTTDCGKFPFFIITDNAGVDVWDWEQPDTEQEPMIKIGGKVFKLSEIENDPRAQEAQRKTALEKRQEEEAIALAHERTAATIRRHNAQYGISETQNPVIARRTSTSSYSTPPPVEEYIRPISEDEARLQFEEEVRVMRERQRIKHQRMQEEISRAVREDCSRFAPSPHPSEEEEEEDEEQVRRDLEDYRRRMEEMRDTVPAPLTKPKKKKFVIKRKIEANKNVHTYSLPE